MSTRTALQRLAAEEVVLTIHADVESRCMLDIGDYGAYRYWEHPSAEVLMMAYRIGDDDLQLWDRSWDYQYQPEDMRQAIADGAVLVAHNAEFEMLAFEWLARNRGWLAPKKYRCTAAMAAALALPRDLETLGKVLNLDTQKDKRGKDLIKLFSIPTKSGTFNDPLDFPDAYHEFREYCVRDVLTEEAAERRMLPLSAAEEEVYRLSLTINRRGLRIDVRSARAALQLAEKSKGIFDKAISETTGGAVTACTQAQALFHWINAQGVAVPTANKADLTEALDSHDTPFHVKQAIRLRLAAGKTSVSKIQTMLRRASPRDARVRGAFIYHVASTGRFQSTGVNFANLPRPRKIFEAAHLHTNPARLFQTIRSADPRLLELLYGDELGNPMHLLSDAVRGLIWAAPGKKLIVADYSGIEGAVIAWLAGEDWKLAAMQEIIRDPEAPDMYQIAAARITGLPTEAIGKKHPWRQSIGKVSELALGYQGGVGAFASMARTYAVDLDALYEPVHAQADPLDVIAAEKRYAACCTRKEKTTLALSPKAWLACELIKRAWRGANAAIKQSWWDLEEAVRTVVRNPGVTARVAGVQYRVMHGYLFCMLPSGRCLAYASPKLRAQVYASRKIDGVWAEPEVMEASIAEKLVVLGKARIERQSFPKATALGVDGKTKQFTRFGLYGGLLAENNTQAVARDILVNGMLLAERANYPIIGTIYDEIITEVPKAFGSANEFARLICQLPPWAAGLPLVAHGYEAKRYRKD
jgi:DNA polymerase